MGWYINPPNQTKEEWLKDNGEFLGLNKPPPNYLINGRVAVCLIDNGWMTAAGIAVDKDEFEAILYPDERPRYWFMVAVEKLTPYLDGKVVV